MAASGAVSGEVNGTELVVGSTVRTVASNGTTIQLYYNDGIGLFNSTSLRIGPIKDSTGEQFATTTVMGPSTGGTYNLATNVLATTKFRLQWRASESVSVNTGWGGTLYW